MELRKNPEYDLEKKRGLFFSIGLMLSFSIVIAAFEWNIGTEIVVVQSDNISYSVDPIVPLTEIPPPEPPKPKVVASQFVEVFEEEELDIPDIDIVIDQEEIFSIQAKEVNEPVELEEEIAEEVFLFVEKMPEPVGGYSTFYAYLNENLHYPNSARKLGIEGKVFVKFVVSESGAITSPEVVKGIGAGCDEEAVRVVKGAPAWIPGDQRGKKVKVQIILPINFVLHKGT